MNFKSRIPEVRSYPALNPPNTAVQLFCIKFLVNVEEKAKIPNTDRNMENNIC